MKNTHREKNLNRKNRTQTIMYHLVCRNEAGELLAALNWLALDISQLEENLSPEQRQLRDWLQQHSSAGTWSVESDELDNRGCTQVDQVGAVQDHVVSLGLTTRDGIRSMAEIRNCRVQRLQDDGEWVSVERREDAPRTYPRLEWQGGEFVVANKKRKAPSSSSAAPKKKQRAIVLKIVMDIRPVTESRRWAKYHKAPQIRASVSDLMNGDDAFPVQVLATVRGVRKKVDAGNMLRKEGDVFRVVSTTFRERKTNSKGCICLPGGGYQTAAGVVYAEFEDTQRPVLKQAGLPPVGVVLAPVGVVLALTQDN